MAYSLIVFDVDGTLAEAFTLRLLPQVRSFFELVYQGNCEHKPQIAIATNQGGVGLRRLMEQEGFGNPRAYPTLEEVEARLEGLLSALGAPPSLPVYVAFSYRTKEGRWTPVPHQHKGDPRWQPEWRKPSPGMLLEAMRAAGVTPEETLFIGDRTDDRGAARAAGCHFSWAKDFFAQEWHSCEQLAQL
jgi:HAD superfamily hydrolase (TIGR01662 family)